MGTTLLCIDTFSLDPPSLRHHFVPLGRLNYSTYKFTLKETAREKSIPLELQLLVSINS